MPKVVDHEERRAELAAAVWRLASRDGLEAVTVRRVAEEAGWSTGAVVHYFADKEELLLLAFSTVADRVRTRLAEAAEQTTEPLDLVRAWLVEGLPIGHERQAEVRVWFAFLGLALTRPAFARAQRLTYRAWRGRVADLLRDAQEHGDIRADVDPAAAAAALVALVDGLAIQATFEPRALSARRQTELVDLQLDALRG
jgi:TetR/AcrR family transcriptional regulator, transcriptional repressor of bet genes